MTSTSRSVFLAKIRKMIKYHVTVVHVYFNLWISLLISKLIQHSYPRFTVNSEAWIWRKDWRSEQDFYIWCHTDIFCYILLWEAVFCIWRSSVASLACSNTSTSTASDNQKYLQKLALSKRKPLLTLKATGLPGNPY